MFGQFKAFNNIGTSQVWSDNRGYTVIRTNYDGPLVYYTMINRMNMFNYFNPQRLTGVVTIMCKEMSTYIYQNIK